MLKLYLGKIDHTKDVCFENDEWFDCYVTEREIKIDETVKKLIQDIDGVKYAGEGLIQSKFIDACVPIYDLSTGCKTAINIYTYKDKKFYIGECGENALDVIFRLNEGNAFVDYCILPDNMNNDIEIIGTDGSKHIVNNIVELDKYYDKYFNGRRQTV